MAVSSKKRARFLTNQILILHFSSRPPAMPHTVFSEKLGRTLKSFRELMSKADLTEIAEEFYNSRARSDSSTLFTELRSGQKKTGEFSDSAAYRELYSLENTAKSRAFSEEAISCISRLYGISRLMLWPSAGETTEGPVRAKLGSGDDFAHHQTSDNGCVYGFPKLSLEGSDIVPVHLRMERSGASSEQHRHPGDELIVVLKGSIRARFHHSGLSATVNAGDLLHFSSEQIHSVENAGSEEADMFVLRLHQQDGGCRKLFIDDFEKLTRLIERKEWKNESSPFKVKKNLSPPEQLEHIEHLFRRSLQLWMAGSVQEIQSDSREAPFSRIMNPSGVGAILKILESGQDKHVTRRDIERLQRIRRDFNAGRSPEKFNLSGLSKFAQDLGLPEMLFLGCMFPRVSGAVLTSLDQYCAIPNQPASAVYSVPPRMLAGSDLCITLLEMEPGASAPPVPHRHPGVEILLPLEGCFGLENGVEAACGEMLHFKSDTPHRLENRSKTRSRALIIRSCGFNAQQIGGSGGHRNRADRADVG